MRLTSISEGFMSSAGHMALDAAGVIPGLGEPADLTNALWYAKEGDYFSAILSLISMVPEVGDIVGKGTKYLGKSHVLMRQFLEKYGPQVARAWPKVKRMIVKSREWRPYVRRLDRAIQELYRTGHQVSPAASSKRP